MEKEISKWILTLSCQDRLGIVAKIATFLAEHGGFILEMSQFGDQETDRFFLRCVFTFQKPPLTQAQFAIKFTPIETTLGLHWELSEPREKQRLLLLVSKEGHCLNDLLHQSQCGSLPVEMVAVVSNHETFRDLVEWYKIPFYHFPVQPENRREQENKILALVQQERIDLVVLARYMQILSPELTRELNGRAINIHHSFLPSFKGAKPYAQAFERGVKLIGATAHYVSDALDEGPIIEQEVLRVTHMHTPENLKELGKDIECTVLSRAVRYHIEQRIFINGSKTVVFRD